MALNPDFRDLFAAFNAARVKSSLPLSRDLRLTAHRLAARPKGLDHGPDLSLRSRSRGARLLPSGRLLAPRTGAGPARRPQCAFRRSLVRSARDTVFGSEGSCDWASAPDQEQARDRSAARPAGRQRAREGVEGLLRSALLELRASGPDLIIAADSPSVVLIATSLTAWPGWRSEQRPRPRCVVLDHAFVGFVVPPGRCLVRLYYRPRSWSAALAAFVIGVIAVGAIGVAQGRAAQERLRTQI
jgi:hypothetical protein